VGMGHLICKGAKNCSIILSGRCNLGMILHFVHV